MMLAAATAAYPFEAYQQRQPLVADAHHSYQQAQQPLVFDQYQQQQPLGATLLLRDANPFEPAQMHVADRTLTGLSEHVENCEAPSLVQVANRLEPALAIPANGSTSHIVGSCYASDGEWMRICELHYANVQAYATRHGYGATIFGKLDEELHGWRSATWYKLPALLRVLQSPGVQHVFWMDSDSLFMSLAKPLPLPSEGRDFAVSGHCRSFFPSEVRLVHKQSPNKSYIFHPCNVVPDHMNAGHLSLRRSKWSLQLLQDTWNTCPPPPLLSKKNGAEQAALIYNLGGKNASCLANLDKACLQPAVVGAHSDHYEIVNFDVMNGDVEAGMSGSDDNLLVHLWGWQKGYALMVALGFADTDGTFADGSFADGDEREPSSATKLRLMEYFAARAK